MRTSTTGFATLDDAENPFVTESLMPSPGQDTSLEEQIRHWRSQRRRRSPSQSVELDELETALRTQVAHLVDIGLATDEAFLVAAKRIGGVDTLAPNRTEAAVAVCLAVAAALAIKVPVLFGVQWNEDNPATVGFYARNLSLLVLPILTGYFVWKRRLDTHTLRWLPLTFLATAVIVNVYRFAPLGSTLVLTAIHLPIALWLVIGVAHAGGRWGEVTGRMDFIRFSGALFIYYVLIALGGGVFTGFMATIFRAIGINVEWFVTSWLLPCGAAGALVIASWLVEANQRIVENIAPMLTRVFTPLFAAMLIVFLVALVLTGRGINIERDVLLAFDLLLVVVIGLLLYSVSARNPELPPDTFDVIQVVLVVSALVADAVALWAIAARITEFGFTPNRMAALGVNVILLINLACSAWLYVRFLRGRERFSSLERWQTSYLHVYAAWAAFVVIIFPPLFRFI
jgi:hypothetical protein